MADGVFDLLSVKGESDLAGDTRVGGNLTVGDSSTGLVRTLDVNGAVKLSSLDVTNAAALGSLSVTNAATLGSLSVTGTATLNTLNVSGATTLGNDVSVTGNVGVGIRAPQTRLHIQSGRLRIQESDGANGSGVIELSNGAKTNVVFTEESSGHLHLRTDSAAHHVVLQAGATQGNVGIGVAVPTHRLHVVAPEAVGLFEATGTQAYLRFSTQEGLNNRVEITNRPGGRLSLWTAGGGDAFNVTRAGDVGIGTIAPTHRLHVVAPEAVGLFEATGTQAYLRFSTQEGMGNRVEITNRPGGRLSLWTAGGGDVLNVTRAGNVGIGTIDPQTKFHVVGNRIRLQGGNKFLDLRTDGAYLDINSSSPLWINAGGASETRIFNFVQGSSRAIKEDIAQLPLEQALETLAELTPVTFRYKSAPECQAGFIAEDAPVLIATPDHTGIRPMNVIAVLTKIVKEQLRTITALQQRVEHLELHVQNHL